MLAAKKKAMEHVNLVNNIIIECDLKFRAVEIGSPRSLGGRQQGITFRRMGRAVDWVSIAKTQRIQPGRGRIAPHFEAQPYWVF